MGRIYVGESTLFHRAPAPGQKWRAVGSRAAETAFYRCQAAAHPRTGGRLQAFEELHWIINANVVGGLEWLRPGSDRRIRLLLTYYHRFSPYGQVFSQKVETIGLGLNLSF